MSFCFEVSCELKKTLEKISKKYSKLAKSVKKKIVQVIDCKDINHFKNLKGDMSHFKRVHVSSFVLIFRIEEDTIIFECLKHHDKAYE